MCCLCGCAFLRRNLNFWLYLVELHGKKSGTILKILPWSLKSMSFNKLVVVKTFNGFFIFILMKHFHILQLEKSLFLFKLWLWTNAQRSATMRNVTTGLLRRQKYFKTTKLLKVETNLVSGFTLTLKFHPC